MRLIVCGGRDYGDGIHVWATLDALHGERPISIIVHGACKTGADKFAADWAKRRHVVEDRFPANWAAYGRAAGPIRNQQMADKGADAYLAFPGGTGTADMVRRAKAASIAELAQSSPERPETQKDAPTGA